MLGREDQAQELVAEVEARFAEVRGRNPQFEGAGFALVEGPIEGNFFVYTATNPRGLIIENLGFAVPEEIARLDEGSGVVTISEEQLALVDQDVLVWLGADPAAVRQSPLYPQLDAVGAGREVFTDELLLNALALGPS